MKHEGMGRRFSQKDLQHDMNQQRTDAIDAEFDRRKSQIVQDLLVVDQEGKALTGRKVDQYEDQSGIMESELFPEGARILNIGDPWQVLDKEGVTNLEYETGEEADFVYDSERFLDAVLPELESMQERVEYIISYNEVFGRELALRVNAVKEHVTRGIGVEDYPLESKILYDITRLVSEHHGNDDGEGASRELWYAAMRLARGFEDVYYCKKVIQPVIHREILDKRGLSKDDQETLTRRLIEEYRGQKKYKHAELVKGAFPHTPFEDDSFDRVIASWSISAHMFSVMNKSQFRTVWKELDRILKQNGVAYIWPLAYNSGSGDEMAQTLREHKVAGGDAGVIRNWQWYGESDQPTIEWIDDIADDGEFAHELTVSQALIFLPKGTKEGAKKRIENSLNKREEIERRFVA